MPPELRPAGRAAGFLRGLCLLLLLSLVANTWAGVLVLEADRTTQPVNSFDLRLDRDSSLDIAAVAAAPERFVPATAETMPRGFDPRPVWLRLSLQNPGSAPLSRWLAIGHSRLESVQLYEPEGEGSWRVLASGLQVPMASRPVSGPVALFPLTLQPGETRVVYLRAQSRTAQYAGAALWDPLAYRSAQLSVQNQWSMALGGILLAGLLSLLIYIQLRESPYLYFGLEMLLIGGFEASMGGVLQQHLWPASRPFATDVIPILAAGTVIMHCQFVRTFLDLKRLHRGWDHALLAIVGMMAAAALGASVHNYTFWIQWISFGALAAVLIGVVTSYLAWRRGNAAARFTLVSFCIVGVSAIANQAGIYRLSDLAAPMAAGVLPWAILVMAPLILIAITVRAQQLATALVVERETNRAKTTFLAHVSHELRTPLNTIIGFAQLLQRGSRRLSLEEGARAIEGSGRHLLHLIDELLDAARAEIGQLQVTAAPVAFRSWLADMVEVARLQAEDAGNTFSLEEHGAVPEYLCLDSRRLRQVLDNLFSNANRHTRDGRITLRYRGEKSGSRAQLFFEVEDTGDGIAADDLDHIFQPFVRGQSQCGEASRHGVGLGLAIARQLVQYMGGELTADSTPGQGSVFRFHVEGKVLPELPPDPVMPEIAPLQPTGSGNVVMLVEDDPDLRLLLADHFSLLGLTVLIAVNGRDAARQWRDDIALVITDQFMTDGDGWSVLAMAAAQSPATPVVLISAADPVPPEGFPAHLKFAASLRKPVTEADLATLLANFLGLENPVPGAAAKSAAMVLPDAARLANLASLVETGQVTRIEAWAHALAVEEPQCTGFADAVFEAALTLDFPRLAELAGTADSAGAIR